MIEYGIVEISEKTREKNHVLRIVFGLIIEVQNMYFHFMMYYGECLFKTDLYVVMSKYWAVIFLMEKGKGGG